MNIILLVACIGMITGFFILLSLSPTEFTDGIFKGFLSKPKSIKEEINQVTNRKKVSFLKREITEVQQILKITGREKRFPILCVISLALFAVGGSIAIMMSNFFLVPVLAVGFMFLPLWYIRLTQTHFKKDISAELETALSIITTAYLRNEDILTAVEENIAYLNPPVLSVFKGFIYGIKMINPDVTAGLQAMRGQIDNAVFREWCDAMIACQFDRGLKSTLEPVVADDADAIKNAFSEDIIKPYMEKTISVQEFADRLNCYGSYIKDSVNEDVKPTWVGCPLIVHRRCINPMFDISNELSYDRTMKIQTIKAKKEDESKFVMEKSCWINSTGEEIGNKNHFVKSQGEKALDIIVNSFKKYNGVPDLYVISPFTTVIKGIRQMVNQSVELKEYKEEVEIWVDKYCGIVHKFQGKEAKEVIFLLGCDRKASGAVRWVKPNIVNVVVTRAKYRLYIIGDYDVWKKSKIFKITKYLIDNCNV